MSAGARVAVLGPGKRPAPELRAEHAGAAARARVRLAAFAALAAYGVFRWATLLTPAPTARLLGLLGLTLLIVGWGPVVAARSRRAAVISSAVALLAMFALAGVPLAWVLGFRVAVSVRAIGNGLAALPQVYLPYLGVDAWVRVVFVLGAGVLLLDAAMLFAFAPRRFGELTRAIAALPLVALAVVPETLVRPRQPYLQGLIMFVLLVLFMWGDRMRRAALPAIVCAVAVAGAAAGLAAPAVDQHHPWLNYRGLAGSASPTQVETFDWSQHYGPLNWPRTGHEVLEVQAAHPVYWKAENLDLFNGVGWTQGFTQLEGQLPQPSPDVLARWTETLQVTIGALQTSDVIAAGFASRPQNVSEGVLPGYTPGTWTAGANLGPGSSYTVRAYAPDPPLEQLAAAGNQYPDRPLQDDRSMLLPLDPTAPDRIVFAPFHSGGPAEGPYGADGASLVQASPYARAFALARRLARQAPTPYVFVRSVQQYLSRGYTYDENPPVSQFPLETFLFKDKIGYCQQFSGSMALLLRMGGIPARVAAGFTTGVYDANRHRWLVSDLDAHAWVEAWFPHYGWVSFDPTPAAAPARSGKTLPAAFTGTPSPKASRLPARHRELGTPLQAAPTKPTGGHTGVNVLELALVIALALGALGTLVSRRRRGSRDERSLIELERALARCGRPIQGGVTLSALEYRFRASPGAAAYIRAIRLARFAEGAEPPTAAQRRALRAQLRAGLGLSGHLRALWALPPGLGPGSWMRLRSRLNSR